MVSFTMFDYFILISVTLIVNPVYAEEWPSESFVAVTKPVTDKCIKEVNIDISVVEAARNGQLPDDENLKKYLLCVFESFALIDKVHHDFEFWKVMTMVPKDMKKPVFEMGRGCLNIKGEDYPKACLEFVTCLQKADPKRYSFMY